MSIEDIKTQVEQKLAMAHGINAKVKLNFGDDGEIFVDATQNPPKIIESEEDADVELQCAKDVFEGILNGTQDATMAFMMGKLKVKGSMGLAMKLNAFLED